MVHRGVYQLEPGSPAFSEPEKFSITRSWPSGTPGVYQYECSTGMTHQEANQAFVQNIPFLRSFSTDMPELGGDHLLLIYSREESIKPAPGHGNLTQKADSQHSD